MPFPTFHREPVIRAVEALSGEIPSDVTAAIDTWGPLSAQWYPEYEAIVSRVSSEFDVMGDDYNRALLDDPAYLALLGALAGTEESQTAAMNYAMQTCNTLNESTGTTP